MRNSQFKVMTKTGETLLGPVNNNSIFAGTNEVQQVALTGYTTDGASYRLNYGGAESVADHARPEQHRRRHPGRAAGRQRAAAGHADRLHRHELLQPQVRRRGLGAVRARRPTTRPPRSSTALNGAERGPDGRAERATVHAQLRRPRRRSRSCAARTTRRPGSRTRCRAATRSRRSRSRTSTPPTPGNTFRIRIGGKLSGPLGFATRARRRDAGHQPERQRRDQRDLRLRGHGHRDRRERHDRPDDHVRGRERAQGRAAGRGRVRRLRRRRGPVHARPTARPPRAAPRGRLAVQR